MNLLHKNLLLVLVFLCSVSAYSQYYYVQFTNKANSTYSIHTPEAFLSERAILRRTKCNIPIDSTDLPVNKMYLDTLVAYGANIIHNSKWLNGVTITLNNNANLPKIANLPFVQMVECTQQAVTTNNNQYTKHKNTITSDNYHYGTAQNQTEMLQLHKIHQLGFKGQDIHIAVLDNGFYNVNNMASFDSVRPRILGTYNFVNQSADVYSSGTHGTYVLSAMAGFLPNTYMGTALDASYWLFHTEDIETESKLETDNWIAAAEFADSVGVDIITSSLGYTQFDDESMNYTYANMDGKTARVSIAATIAARKGILVFVSAGNDGNNAWKYISAPADADSIITVGGVNAQQSYASFSSQGPSADGRIKPTLCAQASATALINPSDIITTSNGTSFSTPVLAGAVASLWSALPQLSNMQLYDLLIPNAHLYNNPNSTLGYGIPNLYQAYQTITSLPHVATQTIAIYPNVVTDMLYIQANETTEISIFDMQGRILKKQTIVPETNVVYVGDITPGFYILKATVGKKTICVSFIKQ